MATKFDPYYKWLGIPPHEQPPNHYRLLGVPLLTDDEDVIANAADQRIMHVRSFQLGEQQAVSQRLLNEIAKAKVCLLDPRKKSAYDQELRRQKRVVRAKPVATPATPPAPEVEPVAPTIQVAPTKSVNGQVGTELRRGRQQPAFDKRKLFITTASVACVLLGYLLLCGIAPGVDVLGLISNREKPATATATREEPPKRASEGNGIHFNEVMGSAHSQPTKSEPKMVPEVSDPATESAGPNNIPDAVQEQVEEQDAKELPNPEETDQPPTLDVPTPSKTPAVVALAAAPADNNTPTPQVQTTSENSSGAADEWVDLLAWAEGFDWAPRGYNWNANLEGTPGRAGITLKQQRFNRFPLPAIIDGNYEMEVEFVRLSGRESVNVFFPVGNYNLQLELGAAAGKVGGVHWIDGVSGLRDNPTTRRPSIIRNGRRNRIVIRVERGDGKASFQIDWNDAKNYITWSGEEFRLRSQDAGRWKITTIRHPWIGSFDSRTTFDKVRIRMHSGEVRHDVYTPEDRGRDLADGFLRLFGEEAVAPATEMWPFCINQIPLESVCGPEGDWPLIAREFTTCPDFYGAHAPSRLKCSIPRGAASFSVIGYNDASRLSIYKIVVDGQEVFASTENGIVPIKVDLPAGSSLLELLVEEGATGLFDHSYWCYPRFHNVPAKEVTEEMLYEKSRSRGLQISSQSVGVGELTRNQPIKNCKSIPVSFPDAKPCDEFLFSVPNASVTYAVPEGMTRFTAIGYCVMSHRVKFEVWADARQIYTSPMVGIIPIEVKLPTGTKTIELKIDKAGKHDWDHAMWCYPRLHRS